MKVNPIVEGVRKHFRLCCLLLALAAFLVRVPGLDRRSVDIDEIATRDISRAPTWGRIGGRPPLSFFIIAVALKVKDSQTWFLLPTVLFGAATVCLAAWTSRVVFGWRVGLIAGLWLLVSPQHIEYSRFARYYSFMIFFSVWSFLLLYLWLRMRRWRYLLGWVVVSTLNLLCHFFAAFVFAIQAALLAFCLVRNVLPFRSRLHSTRIMTAAGVVVLLIGAGAVYYLAGLSTLVRTQFPVKRWPTSGIEISWAFWRPYLVDMSGWPEPLLPVLLGLLLFGAIKAWQRSRVFLVHFLCILVIPIVAVYAVQPAHFFDTRYVSFVLPFYLMTLSLGAVSLLEEAGKFFGAHSAGKLWKSCLLSGCAVAFPLLGTGELLREHPHLNCRDLVEYLEKHGNAGDLVLFTDTLDFDEFHYFASGRKQFNYAFCSGLPTVLREYYPRRFSQPFWVVAGRLHTKSRYELEKALNSYSHKPFEWGYLFHSSKRLDIDLTTATMTSRCEPPKEPLPRPVTNPIAVRIPVFIENTGTYRVVCNQPIRDAAVRFDSLPLKWIALDSLYSENLRLDEGIRQMVFCTSAERAKALAGLRLSIAPVCGSDYATNAACFDFVRNLGSYDAPAFVGDKFGMCLRLVNQLSYVWFVEKPGEYELFLLADNDRPATNVVSVWIGKERAHRFVYARRDNSLETQRAVVRLGGGLQMISLRNEWSGSNEIGNGVVDDSKKTTFLSTVRVHKPFP